MIFKASNNAEIIEMIMADEDRAIETYPLINHALVIVKCEDDYLLGFHKWRDDWETFGGLLEKGESLRQCICREVDEELGLTEDEVSFDYLGVLHYYMPPSYWVKDWHEEYGGLYGITISKDIIGRIEAARKDRDEIGEIAFLSELKEKHANVDEINEALLKFY